MTEAKSSPLSYGVKMKDGIDWGNSNTVQCAECGCVYCDICYPYGCPNCEKLNEK